MCTSCRRVLDPTDTPAIAEDAELFYEKQKYMFAVFEKILLTDQGKAFVREHFHDSDAH